MLELSVALDDTIFTAAESAARVAGDPDELAAALSALVTTDSAFGPAEREIAGAPGRFFPLQRLLDEDFWSHQRALLGHLRSRLNDSVRQVEAFLPPVPDIRPIQVTVHPVPGLTACYGSGGGHQVFGLFDGADAREMLLFCSHTYLHETAAHINTERSTQAEAEPTTPDALLHLMLLLIRNEGLANFAVLGGVRSLRAEGITMPYFDYAHLVDDERATRCAMAACRTLLQQVRSRPAEQTAPKLTAAFKNPKLPIVNLLGIHLAEAIAAKHGTATLLDIASTEPQEFFGRYAETGDPLASELFGTDGEARALFGVPEPQVADSAARHRALAEQRQRSPGEGLIDLSLGAPVFSPMANLSLAATDPSAARYAPMGGLDELRVALAEKLRSRNQIPADPAEVVVTSGASAALFASLLVLTQPGDRVLIPDPGFPLYRLAARILRLEVTSYQLISYTAGYAPDFGELARAAHGARVLLWNFPSNPLGVVAEPTWAGELISMLRAVPGLTAISDEVYEDIVFEGQQVSPAAAAPPEVAARLWSLFSFSKSHGMAGWRVGYLHAPGGHAIHVARCAWAMSMSTGTPSQLAALTALATPREVFTARIRQLLANRDMTVAKLRGAGLPAVAPSAGLFCWLDVSPSGLDGETFAERARRDCGVLLSPGTDFSPGAVDRVRLSFAVEREALSAALDRLSSWLGSRAALGHQPGRR